MPPCGMNDSRMVRLRHHLLALTGALLVLAVVDFYQNLGFAADPEGIK